MTRNIRKAALLGLLLPLLACGKGIGDECETQFDCNDEDNSRTCDISQPGGYCTVEGCDERSCPSEAVCVRFFPREEFLTTRCPDAICSPQEVCLGSGWCAPRASEITRCMKSCGDNGDCRGGYECRATGIANAMAFSADPAFRVKYCAPHE